MTVANGSPARKRWWRQWRWRAAAITLLVLILADIVGAFTIPPLLVGHATTAAASAEASLRSAILSLLGALTPLVAAGAAVAALLNFQETREHNRRTFEITQRQLDLAREQFAAGQEQTREQVELQRRGQLTERFTRSIDQLGQTGRERLDLRIGGLYGLEQVAFDDPEQLHSPVVEVVTAFIRRSTEAPRIRESDGSYRIQVDLDPSRTTAPGPDIQAALTILGRRTHSRDRNPPNLQFAEIPQAQLSGAHLERANLFSVNLMAAQLLDAQMTAATLTNARLQTAILVNARLGGASLTNALLQGSFLGGADLTNTILAGAQLVGANVDGTNFQGAFMVLETVPKPLRVNLSGVDLSRAMGLTQEQLDEAICDDQTKAPQGLTVHHHFSVEDTGSFIYSETQDAGGSNLGDVN